MTKKHFFGMQKCLRLCNCKNYTNKRTCVQKQSAFTLAELLTSVLIISVIMIILAPVITKRMKDNLSVSMDQK